MKPQNYLFEEWLLILILIIQVVLVCGGILCRYVFNWPLSFTEELTRYLLIWLACAGFSAGFQRKETIQFQWPASKPAWLNKTLHRIAVIGSTLFMLILLVSSLQMIELQWRYNQRTSVMGWPVEWVSAAFPVAVFLFLYRLWRRQSNPPPPEKTESEVS